MNRHNDKNIKEVLQLFLQKNKPLNEGFQSSKIEELWNLRMGKTIASYTSGIQLKNGNLVVYITSGPLKKELQMAQDKIMEILNEEMNEMIVKNVKIL
ncbi:MAG: DUF721 domain-containing protein [Saprospiraceae bacterium]